MTLTNKVEPTGISLYSNAKPKFIFSFGSTASTFSVDRNLGLSYMIPVTTILGLGNDDNSYVAPLETYS